MIFLSSFLLGRGGEGLVIGEEHIMWVGGRGDCSLQKEWVSNTPNEGLN